MPNTAHNGIKQLPNFKHHRKISIPQNKPPLPSQFSTAKFIDYGSKLENILF